MASPFDHRPHKMATAKPEIDKVAAEKINLSVLKRLDPSVEEVGGGGLG